MIFDDKDILRKGNFLRRDLCLRWKHFHKGNFLKIEFFYDENYSKLGT